MRLLIVDDEEILIDILQRTLKNYALDAVTDGEQGWIYGSTYPYDLIILDWSLPKLDGLSLCRRFRKHGYHMPILLLTVRNSSPEKIRALDAGVDDYLCKPFDVEELAARIRALLRRSNSRSPLLSWGDLELNPSNCQVIYQGHSILLTAKEYQLLELFMRHSQEVFGIEDILESLWPSVEYISEATVRSHLRNLRKKLKLAGLPEDPIETLRGRGYYLKPRPQNNKLGRNFLPLQPEDKADKQARHLAALSTAWNRYRNKCHQQLAILEEALQAWKNGYLSPNKRKEARLSAHNLAGNLGIFGFDECSQLARELEELLQKTVQEEKGQLLSFQTIFNDLLVQLAIEDNPSHKISSRLTKHCPLLLVIDDDRNFTELLSQKAISEGIQMVVVPTPELARTWLEGLQDRLLPNAVLLRLSLTGSRANSKDLEERLSLIAEFKLLVPSIPVIIIADRDHFRDRLLVARHGGALYLKQPLLASEAISFCQKVLEHSSWGKKVMIVDDDVELLRVLPDLLEPWGFKLTTLDDPRQFWEVLQAVNPDLLVLDIEMPYLSGIELCKVLRSYACWSRLPVLYLSIHTGVDMRDEVFASGADELVPKPIVGKQLADRILHHLADSNIMSN
ncbi:response regulator [Dapis sp. BLCC M126]|uniref:response regulator n=1 Tax=Dapis sp. BLCC M126 TaxID=3400189 RepID=UPI003CEA8931